MQLFILFLIFWQKGFSFQSKIPTLYDWERKTKTVSHGSEESQLCLSLRLSLHLNFPHKLKTRLLGQYYINVNTTSFTLPVSVLFSIQNLCIYLYVHACVGECGIVFPMLWGPVLKKMQTCGDWVLLVGLKARSVQLRRLIFVVGVGFIFFIPVEQYLIQKGVLTAAFPLVAADSIGSLSKQEPLHLPPN